MSSVYTKRLLSGQPAAGASLSAVVPAGRIWIITGIDCVTSPPTGDAGPLAAQVQTTYFWLTEVLASIGRTYSWRGKVVAYAGEALSANNFTSTLAFMTITGYEFAA